MRRPKNPSTDTRYLCSSAFNSKITIQNPNAGQAADGTLNVPIVVATNVNANMSPWRGKEVDKSDTRVALSSYKIVIRYPKTYNIDTGCQIIVRNQLHSIDSFYDPDGQRVELHIYTFVTDDSVVNS